MKDRLCYIEAEDKIIIEHYENQNISIKEISKMIKDATNRERNEKSITNRALVLGKTRPTRWTKEQDAFLRMYHNKLSYEEIAEEVNKTVGGVKARKNRLKIYDIEKKEGMKRCSSCKEYFPSTNEYFPYADKKNNKLYTYCLKCKRKRDQLAVTKRQLKKIK